MLSQTGNRADSRIVGEVKDDADLLGQHDRHPSAMASGLRRHEDTFDCCKLAPGADADTVQDRIDTALARQFPTVEVLNQQELKRTRDQINQLLGLFYVLLSLALSSPCSGSPTRWRCRSTSARASSGCSARSACRGARCARDPLRVGDHRADRRGARHGARPDLRRADVGAAPGPGLRARYPVGQLVLSWSWRGSPACSRRSPRPGGRRAWTCSRRWRTSSLESWQSR